MSERDQDALLDKIERRRRRRVIWIRATVVALFAVALAIGAALVVAR
jgi:type IV secretory pathway component VirB8